VPHSPAAAAAAEARRSWQGSRRPQQEPSFWQTAGRRRATPLLFSAACIVGGCALFVGAVQANRHLCAPLWSVPALRITGLLAAGLSRCVSRCGMNEREQYVKRWSLACLQVQSQQAGSCRAAHQPSDGAPAADQGPHHCAKSRAADAGGSMKVGSTQWEEGDHQSARSCC